MTEIAEAYAQRQQQLKQLRYNRTRTSNSAQRTMHWMLAEPATHTLPNGLPSWWPFWSDVLKENTREAVRAARALAAAEGVDL